MNSEAKISLEERDTRRLDRSISLYLLRIRDFWGRYRRNRAAVFGLFVIFFFFMMAVLSPYVAPYDPFKMYLSDKKNVLLEPSWGHIMGTDHLARDMLSRVIWGTRISLFVGFIAAGISALIGIAAGAIAGYYGGWVDDLLMRFVDMFMVIPTFFLVLVVVAIFGSDIWNIMVVIGLTSWPSTARLMRGQFLALKGTLFVEAEKALGANDRRIILHCILPNGLYPVVVNMSLQVAGAILTEASLSFLGLGDPTQISWGLMLYHAQRFLRDAWWMTFFPGLAISITILGFNLIGDGLNDALNPRLRIR
jgi:peptide/nickel transport system permease protein